MAVVNKLQRTIPNLGGILWTNVGGSALINGDQSQPIQCLQAVAAKSVMVTGTFGAGGSIQAEGSNDGVNFFIVGSAITAAGLQQITAVVEFIRLNVTAGDGTTALFATIAMVAQRGS